MGSDKVNKGFKNYAFYTGLGFQMVAVIGLFTYIGYRIDGSKEGDSAIFTALFALLGVLLSLVGTILPILKRNKGNK